MPLAADVDFEALADAAEHFTGAELEGLCREAALAALRTRSSADEFGAQNPEEAAEWEEDAAAAAERPAASPAPTAGTAALGPDEDGGAKDAARAEETQEAVAAEAAPAAVPVAGPPAAAPAAEEWLEHTASGLRYKVVYRGPAKKTRVGGLDPGGRYRFFVATLPEAGGLQSAAAEFAAAAMPKTSAKNDATVGGGDSDDDDDDDDDDEDEVDDEGAGEPAPL